MTRTENRSWIKLAVAAVVLILSIAMVPVKAHAANVNFTYNPNEDSVTVSWEAPTPYSYRTVTGYTIYDDDESVIATVIDPTITTYTKSGLGNGYVNYWKVSYSCVTEGGTTGEYSIGTTYVNTKPKSIKKKDFSISYVGESNKTFSVSAKKPEKATGFEVAVYNGKKMIGTKQAYSYASGLPFKFDTALKYRVRAYYYNSATQTNYYSDWSDYKFFEVPTLKLDKRYNKRAARFSIRYGAGVKNFSIYVSNNQKKGFKKFATVAPTKSKKTKTVIVNKYGKSSFKRGTYYIRVIPNIVNGKKLVESEIYYTIKCTIY